MSNGKGKTKIKKPRKPVHDGTARMALHVLIRWYTTRRDWFMVERLMNDLGRLEIKSIRERAAKEKKS